MGNLKEGVLNAMAADQSATGWQSDPERSPDFQYSGLPVRWRRRIVLALNLATIAGLGYVVYRLLSPDGIDGAEAVMLIGFMLATPWTVLGFWNAVIGIVLQHGPGDPSKSIYPFYPQGQGSQPIALSSRTALTIFLRNEDPRPVFARIEAMQKSLQATGLQRHFRFFVLSDTSEPDIIQLEEAGFDLVAAHVVADGGNRPVYRRRADNAGFKAGNIQDFLKEHGSRYDFFLPLDSDSVMSGDVMIRLVAAMEARPELGILQTLVVGVPAESGFARMFQFGMRHGMRSFTLGSAWWSADCGPYWGHNALIRAAAFEAHCNLPVLPGSPPLGGHVLSHDQLEATYMRRGGYEVRVLPIETQSFEANPPTLLEFAKRDLRWCQGNMQYWRFLFEPGLKPLSRFQLFQAVLMYVAPPAWIVATFAAAWKGVTGGFDATYIELGFWSFITIFLLSVTPKIAGVVDVLLTPGAIRSYGGPLRFGLSAVIELLASMIMAPIVAVYVSVFLIGLLFGRSVTWSGQNRDRLGVTLGTAVKAMGLQTLIGVVLATIITGLIGGYAIFWALPVVAGLCLAIPFTVFTASQRFGYWTTRLGLFAIPEEGCLPRVLTRLVPHEARLWRRPSVRVEGKFPKPARDGQA
ncbi:MULTISPECIES: glucans biosynthesis glucosyltransferase MdoH [unclassified Rhizobium]|uniref:glucans biosynthesis glucosyltransferase MdoH n=1 Tax=unclassified Rhizobium TaxID=2613769 RepID=UPI001AE24D6E|nr:MULTISPECIES: glucans biosynthesis glucosyltransferase MdoH [unclassified Rhizobium]MBP2459441.1 membrane glycosyltransferase [Rhizobium sp. PvP014]MBP2531735.1 membrane glycosyltransferase [Rhizobium sp. PvP099]